MRFHNYFLPHCVLMCTPRGIFFRQLLSRQLFSHFLFGQQTVIEIHSKEFSFYFRKQFCKITLFIFFPNDFGKNFWARIVISIRLMSHAKMSKRLCKNVLRNTIGSKSLSTHITYFYVLVILQGLG